MQTSSAIKIVIVYETAAIAVRAKEMSEELAAELQSECDSWEMDLLAQPFLFWQAVASASEADMIIIAARSAGALPGHVRNWIETWLPQKKNGPTALVVLLDEEGESLCKPPPCCVYLHQVAERGNMDFFCNASQWTLRDFPSANQIIPRHQIRAFDPELRLEPAWLGCGIND